MLPDEAQYWHDVNGHSRRYRPSLQEIRLKEEKRLFKNRCKARLKELLPGLTDLQLRKESMKHGGYVKYLKSFNQSN